MPNLANNDYLRIRVYNENPTRAQVSINTYYMKATEITGTWTDKELAVELGKIHAPLWRGWQSSRTRYKSSSVQRVTPNPSPEVEDESSAGPGTNGVVTIPTQVTGLILAQPEVYHTGSRTVKHPDGTLQLATARMYISFPSQANLLTTTTLSDGRMKTEAYDLLVIMAKLVYGQAAVFASGGKSLVLTPYVRSVTTNYTVDPPTSVVNFYQLTSKFASRLWATQKRRGDRGQKELFAI